MTSRPANPAPFFFPLLLGALVATAGCGSPAAPAPPPPAVAPAAAVTSDSGANDPRVQAEKLSDPAARDLAVHRLVQLFEDEMSQDDNDTNGPNVKPLRDVIVEPLARICAGGGLDGAMRSKVVRLLADARDPRGVPCLVETLKGYTPNENVDDVRVAARAVAEMKPKGAAGPLFEVFTKLRHSNVKASLVTRDVHDALLVFADPSWEAPCITMLGRPIAHRKDIDVLKDEFYWQSTCSEILGRIGGTNAVDPLVKILLSPVKADVQATAVHALVAIGKPAIDPTVKLLQGGRADLMEYAKDEALKANAGEAGAVPDAAPKKAKTAYVGLAALILGSIGRREAVRPMIDALAQADDESKVIIARELLKLPISKASLEAVQRVFEKTSISMTTWPGINARELLLESMVFLFDPTLVPWIVKTALAAKGEDADVEHVRSAALMAAMKTMNASQVPEVDKLYKSRITDPDGKPSTIGKLYEREYKMTTDLLKECSDSLDCWFAKLRDPSSHAEDRMFVGFKSVYMIGALGGPDVRAKLVELLPVMQVAARHVAMQVIDQKSPDGDRAIAAAFERRVEEAQATKDPNRIAAAGVFKLFADRLRTRAQ
ncbi:HEAT repeat domain-containing protein [Polyangium mundeleinium]|uniref:HEAT repeat domain-containing protein n=1 Tax=Polyangium mundeleinium TaxID=2995306 RepID=A0ABT5EQU8_9BACT|nr:hypothetical protein [Polyangium mundeleinium]MDC0744218.1 hypothetical protein [Polyangium mundeleinium]